MMSDKGKEVTFFFVGIGCSRRMKSYAWVVTLLVGGREGMF